jgi:hypothetical protein
VFKISFSNSWPKLKEKERKPNIAPRPKRNFDVDRHSHTDRTGIGYPGGRPFKFYNRDYLGLAE